jgi:microcystin-dependent protein
MDQFVGEIRLFAGNYAPDGWMFCNGQSLPIQQYAALYSLLGNTYGGDGRSNFNLPDLRGRTTMGTGRGASLSPRVLGESAGESKVTLTTQNMPAHTHNVNAKAAVSPANKTEPAGAIWAETPAEMIYTNAAPDTLMAPTAVSAFPGGNGAHNNVQPCAGINYIIAVTGIFPNFG